VATTDKLSIRSEVAKTLSRATSCEVDPHAGDRIRIEQLEMFAQVGVTSEERGQPQRIVLNLTIWPETDFERLRDDIAHTVNYVELCRVTQELVESHEWNLIETLASTLASNLLAKFPLKAAEIEIRKFVLPNTKYVAVTARRNKTG
jgi:dihydroneopterin aldolase